MRIVDGLLWSSRGIWSCSYSQFPLGDIGRREQNSWVTAMVRVKGSQNRDQEGESEIQDMQVSLRMGLGAEVGSPVGTGRAEGKTMRSQPRALSEDIRSGLRE